MSFAIPESRSDEVGKRVTLYATARDLVALEPVSLEEIRANIVARDKADMTRAISPLRQADDAIVLDNSHMSVDEQMAWFMNEFQLKMKN